MSVDKKINYELQGKEKPAKNYLGKQKTVTVPVKWKSNPKAPATELAYITKAEKDLLVKKDIHGSLKKGPNTGPSGVMSLDSQGDYTRDRSDKGIQRDSSIDPRERDQREQQMKDLLTGNVTKGQTVKKGPRTRQYSDLPEYMKVKQDDGTYKNTYIGSAYKSYGTPTFLGNLFSRGAPGYRGIKGLSAFGTPTFTPYETDGEVGPDGTTGYFTDDQDFAEMRPAIPSFGILGLLSNLAKRFRKPTDMSRFNDLQLVDGELVDDPDNNIILPDSVKNRSMVISNPFDKPFADPYKNTVGTTANTIDANKIIVPEKKPNRSLDIFDEYDYGVLPPLSVNAADGFVNDGITNTNAFTNANFDYFMDDYTNQLEQGEPISTDEQMFIDNEIFKKRFP